MPKKKKKSFKLKNNNANTIIISNRQLHNIFHIRRGAAKMLFCYMHPRLFLLTAIDTKNEHTVE